MGQNKFSKTNLTAQVKSKMTTEEQKGCIGCCVFWIVVILVCVIGGFVALGNPEVGTFELFWILNGKIRRRISQSDIVETHITSEVLQDYALPNNMRHRRLTVFG